MKTILSLFDHSGNWSEPYRKAGYNVIQQDIKLGFDIFGHTLPDCLYQSVEGAVVHGVLAAVPCTEFAASGARWWKDKAQQPAEYVGPITFDNKVDMAIGMALAVLAIVEWLKPVWWVIENPIGRLQKLVPEIGPPRLIFNPCDYGDPYTKRTCLFGEFNEQLPKTPVLPLYGSMIHRMSSNWKEQRSITPKGFAAAFFKANP